MARTKQTRPTNVPQNPKPVALTARERLADMGINLDDLGSPVIPYSEDKAGKILCLVADGVPVEAACGACNVTIATLGYWREMFPAYDEALEIALGHLHAEVAAVVVGKAKAGDLDAARFVLERRFPTDWQPQSTIELSFKKMSNKDLEEYLRNGGVDQSAGRAPLPLPSLRDDEEGVGGDAQPEADGDVVLESQLDSSGLLNLGQTCTADTQIVRQVRLT